MTKFLIWFILVVKILEAASGLKINVSKIVYVGVNGAKRRRLVWWQSPYYLFFF